MVTLTLPAADFPPGTRVRKPKGTKFFWLQHEIKIYEGTPHSFFDRSYEEHAETAADAWKRVLAFIARNR